MEAEQVDQGQARGVQSRLRARAEAARTTHDKAAWTRVAILHQLVGCRRLDPDWAKGLAFLSWLHESGRVGGPDDGSPGRDRTPTDRKSVV